LAQEDLNLSPENQKKIADIIKENDLCKLDRDSLTNSIDLCHEARAASWYQRPQVMIGGAVIIFDLGLIVGLTKCLGLCP
jgi:hypothetical protein